MIVVQQADFEKIKSEYDVTILIVAGKRIGHCHYLHDFILCILALHGFASKITTICFNSESAAANKTLLNVYSCDPVGRYSPSQRFQGRINEGEEGRKEREPLPDATPWHF